MKSVQYDFSIVAIYPYSTCAAAPATKLLPLLVSFKNTVSKSEIQYGDNSALERQTLPSTPCVQTADGRLSLAAQRPAGGGGQPVHSYVQPSARSERRRRAEILLHYPSCYYRTTLRLPASSLLSRSPSSALSFRQPISLHGVRANPTSPTSFSFSGAEDVVMAFSRSETEDRRQ